MSGELIDVQGVVAGAAHKPERPLLDQQPNRFTYYAAAAWTAGPALQGYVCNEVTTNAPVVTVAQIQKIAEMLAGTLKIKGRAYGGLILDTPKVQAVIISLITLRTWYEPAPPAPANENGGSQ